ncbi:hypothetical protein ACWDTT_10550 [Streptosporangium sandarakinum]
MSDQVKLHYEFYLNEKKVNPQPFEVVLNPRIGHNTVVTVRVQLSGSASMRLKQTLPAQGTPARLVWGLRPDKLTTWYGYVSHAEPTAQTGGHYDNLIVTYVLVGTSRALAAQATKDWRNITDSGIAKEIAQRYNLSFVGHRTTKIHPYLYQHGISDLDWLRERAQASSRQLHIDNGILYFTDPASLALATTATPVKARMDREPHHYDLVHDVRPLHGSLVPTSGKQAYRQVTGLDIKSGQLLSAQSVPNEPGPQFVARGTAITSVSDLYTASDALAVGNEQWLRARITLHGDVAAVPGNLLNLTGKAVAPSLEGLWMVVEASHTVRTRDVSGLHERVSYEADLVVARNRSTTVALRDGSMPKISDACTLAGAQWVASARREVLL